jgi:hypothetical protein
MRSFAEDLTSARIEKKGDDLLESMRRAFKIIQEQRLERLPPGGLLPSCHCRGPLCEGGLACPHRLVVS